MSNKKPYLTVQQSREVSRWKSIDFINEITNHFSEMHGDQLGEDCPTITSGIALIENIRTTIIFQNRGKNLKENLYFNYGMAYPSGYRKAIRQMKLAEKFNRPILCFIDTPGAACDIKAEENGQASAIAHSIETMISVRTPVITFIISEGGSGGAIAISASDKNFMLENAVLSVISPEGFAAIVWKDSSRGDEAATQLKLTAEDLLKENLIDGIIREVDEKTDKQISFDNICKNIKKTFIKNYQELRKLEKTKLLKLRFKKYYQMGKFS